MKSYRVKEEAKSRILTQYLFCSVNWSQLWQLTSPSDICERLLADSYLNIYIHRRVVFLD